MKNVNEYFMLSIGLTSLIYFCLLLTLKVEFFRRFIKNNDTILHPNNISIAGAALGWLSGILYIFDFPYFSIPLFLVSWMLDGLDGQIARKCGLGSEAGEIIDPLMDKLRYFFLLLIILLVNGISLWFFSLLFIIDFIGGQFIVRRFIKKNQKRFLSVAANMIGKIKTNAINVFILVYFYANLGGDLLPLEYFEIAFYVSYYIIIGLAFFSGATKLIQRA